MGLLLAASVSVRSQEAAAPVPPTSAPVVAEPVAPSAAPTAPETTPAAPAASFLPHGQFDTATQNWADGWSRGSEGSMTWELEDGQHFIRLVSQQAGQLVAVSQTAPIPAGVKGIDSAIRFRTAGVKFGASFSCDARVLFKFLDAGGQEVGPAPGASVFDSHASAWTVLQKGFLVPDGAAQIAVTLCLNKPASGTLDVQSVSLSPMSDADVQAIVMAPAIAAQKLAADQAEVDRMLALPPKTLELKVSGNKLVTADGTVVTLQGVNVESLEWVAKGENVLRTTKVALEDWKANVIRLPVYDGFWFGQGKPPQSTSNDPDAYRQLVDNVVKMAAGQGAYVVLDLHRFHAPEDRDVAFWKDAAARYKNNPAVLFDLFNEPGGISWDIWKNGGEVDDKAKNSTEIRSYQSPGMQGLLDTVRATGAKNIVIAGGLGSAYDLGGITQGFALEDKTGNGIMYSVHFYNWHKNWEKHFLFLADQYPLYVGEFGADIKKMPFVPANQQEDPYTWVPDAIGMVQKYHLNWTAFSLHPKSTPVLISNWDYAPTPFWGVFIKDALAGKQFDMTHER